MTKAAAVQDFMLGNKLFIVCEYMPYSLLQLLEGTAEPPDPSSNIPPPGQLSKHAQRGLLLGPYHSMLLYVTQCCPNKLTQVCLAVH